MAATVSRERGVPERDGAATAYGPARFAKDGKVMEGKDGWLFLADDSNEVLDQHNGSFRLSDSELEGWRSLLEGRAQRMAAIGCKSLFLVAPDNHAIYDEQLPDHVRTAPKRPVHQIIEHLEEARSSVNVTYPLAELRRAKPERPVCDRVDSHWNDFGAFVAYEQLANQIEAEMPMRRLERSEIIFVDHQDVGDLSFKLEPPRRDKRTISYIRTGKARLVHDNQVEAGGTLVITECRDAPPTTCVLVGDSYSWSLLKYLSESFGRFVFLHTSTFDRGLIDRESPDVVINVTAERFLRQLPDDEAGKSAAEEEVEKLAQGRTRPKFPWWDNSTDEPSLESAERMRAYLLSEGRVGDATIVSLLTYAGLFPTELRSLRWSDVAGDRLIVPAVPNRRRKGFRASTARLFRRLLGKGEPRRVVPMNDYLLDDLDRWRRFPDRPESTFVIPGPSERVWQRGDWVSWRDRVFRPVAAACRLPDDLRPYQLRHAFSFILISAGASADAVAAQLGAKPADINQQYGALMGNMKHGSPISAHEQISLARRRSALKSQSGKALAPAHARDGS